MNRRLLLGVSIALAILSALLLQLYKQNLADELGVGGPRVSIVVAREALPAFSAIRADQLTVASYPEAWLPPAYVPESLRGDLVGRTVGSRVPEGVAVTMLHIANGLTGQKLSAVIPEGYRALTITTRKTAFMDLVKPGDHVDVLLTLTDPRERSVETTTLLQAVAVLAVGHETGMDSGYAARGGPGSTRRSADVTVAVSAQEAEILVLAQDQGELALTLRLEGDVESEDDLAGWDLRDLIGREEIPPIQQARDWQNCTTVTAPGKGGTQTICQ